MVKKIIIFLLVGFLLINFPLNIYSKEVITEENILIDEILDNYDQPKESSQVSNLPWRNNIDFISFKEKYNTPYLLAGFCAVLKNPLPGEEFNIDLITQKINGYILEPGDTFSQNSLLGPYNKENGYKKGASYTGGNIIMTEGGGVCKLSGILYNLSVLSDLEIIERHNHSMPVNYLPYGQDATVAYGSKDFQFKNNTKNRILIWTQFIGNRLYMGFYGGRPSPVVKWDHQITDPIEPSVKYIKNDNLKSGEMNTITKGLKGATVKSTITVNYRDGTIAIRNMGTSRYSPLPRIIEIN